MPPKCLREWWESICGQCYVVDERRSFTTVTPELVSKKTEPTQYGLTLEEMLDKDV